MSSCSPSGLFHPTSWLLDSGPSSLSCKGMSPELFGLLGLNTESMLSWASFHACCYFSPRSRIVHTSQQHQVIGDDGSFRHFSCLGRLTTAFFYYLSLSQKLSTPLHACSKVRGSAQPPSGRQRKVTTEMIGLRHMYA